MSTGRASVLRFLRPVLNAARLGEIEKQLSELLPGQFQRPLENILDGILSPFNNNICISLST